MKIKKLNLLNELELVSSGLSNREIIEQSDSFVFVDGTLFTFNEEVSCRIDSCLEDLTAAVKAKPLLEVLRKMTEDEIEINFDDSEFRVRGKRREAGIRLEKDIVLPIRTVEQTEDWNSLPDDFDQAVQLVSQCTSKDESQFRLTCIHITPDELQATDNYQLSQYKTSVPISGSTLVRRDSLKAIVDLGMDQIAETENWLHFKNQNGLVVSCRRYEVEKFPDFSNIIEFTGEKTKLPTGISDAVEKAQIFSSENLDTDLILVELKSGKLRIRGEGSNGWFTEVRKVTYSGNDLSFRIAPKLLIQLCNQHDECELNENLIKVQFDNFTYVTSLNIVEKNE
jgi:DNA polymerase III sliding clamp (beta) subunit (PCNA family)